MRTLCLDLATQFGFAVGDQCGVVAHGSHKLPSTGNDIGAFLYSYQSWLSSAISRWEPGEIVFESPVLPANTQLNTLRKLYSLCGVTELIAGNRQIPVREANLSSIRLHFVGVARAPKAIPAKERRQWIKDAVMLECRKRGFRPADDNAGDALALFSYTLAQKDRRFRMLGDEIPMQEAA